MPEFREEFDAKPLSGDEELTRSTSPRRFAVRDFWVWSSSDLLSNAKRGVFAEFIVAADFDVAGDVRAEWDAYDLTTKSGIKVEVKSAAYLQSWHQDKLSSISFSVAKSRAWDPTTNEFSDEKQRQADVYVFCLLKHQEMSTVDPLDMSQWESVDRLRDHRGPPAPAAAAPDPQVPVVRAGQTRSDRGTRRREPSRPTRA